MEKIKEIVNLLLKMVFSLKFLGAVAAMVMLYSQHSIEAMLGIVIAYLAIKSIINTGINLKEGEFEYHFVDDAKLNSVICWFLSTKSWIAVMCYFLILKAAGVVMSFTDFNFQFVQVSEGWLPVDKVAPNIEALGIAFGSAIGLPEIAGFIKGNIKVKKLEKPIQQPVYNAPVAAQDVAASPSASQPVVNRPAPAIFDEGLLLTLATEQAKKFAGQGKPTTERIFYSCLGYAQDVNLFHAYNMGQVRDGYGWLLQYGKGSYYDQSGFPWGEAHKHLADKNPSCPYSSVMQMARAEGYEDTTRELIRLEENLGFIEWAEVEGVDLIARAPANMLSIYGIGEIAREVYRITPK